jgi:hypothetical protein
LVWNVIFDFTLTFRRGLDFTKVLKVVLFFIKLFKHIPILGLWRIRWRFLFLQVVLVIDKPLEEVNALI